jgi:hypothetical protein
MWSLVLKQLCPPTLIQSLGWISFQLNLFPLSTQFLQVAQRRLKRLREGKRRELGENEPGRMRHNKFNLRGGEESPSDRGVGIYMMMIPSVREFLRRRWRGWTFIALSTVGSILKQDRNKHLFGYLPAFPADRGQIEAQ